VDRSAIKANTVSMGIEDLEVHVVAAELQALA
jgi:hypothetical protein